MKSAVSRNSRSLPEMVPQDPARWCEEDLAKIGLEKFYTDLQLRGQAPVSSDTKLRVARRYCKWSLARGIDPRSSGREDLLAYLADMRARGLMQSSLKKDFSCLSVWFEYLVDAGQIDLNPIPNLNFAHVGNKERF